MLTVFAFVFFSQKHGDKLAFIEKTESTCNFTVDGRDILIRNGDGWDRFEIRGVDLGTGIPGNWSTDFAADKETYLRWFRDIQAMGANTVRIYTVNPVSFYDAFYEFNSGNDNPLYLLQGVWVDENAQNSHIDAFDPAFIDAFIRDCRQAADVIHGKRIIGTDAPKNIAKGSFRKDVSPWVLGYIIGVEWEPVIVSYTNDMYSDEPEMSEYNGEYLYTTADASPFEAMLCRAGDSLISYEFQKYGQQRLLAFSNWPTTDPFEYPEEIKRNLNKYCCVDVEHIKAGEKRLSGQFASYHVYPYYPNYINYLDDWSLYGISDKKDYLIDGVIHSYRAYLHALVQHHSVPVIISEFGVPSSRGMASQDERQGFDQGGMSEAEQAAALTECYKEIMEAGCAGSCVFSWQDEWFKRTWNTMHAVNLRRTCFWPDYQTNEQHFGLLSFDLVNPESIYNDGDVSEWRKEDIISSADGLELYMKSDAKYVYFRIHGRDMRFENDRYCIPIDVTPKSGSTTCSSLDLSFSRPADFLIEIQGKEHSRILVQERYDALRSTYSMEVNGFDTYIEGNIPSVDSAEFVDIRLPLQEPVSLVYGSDRRITADSYITGKLLYGNGNPDSSAYLSNSDFISSGNNIELRIPWQLLNFSDPTSGEIHDDYYENYGISYMHVDSIYAGISRGASDGETVYLNEYRLPKTRSRPITEERLKEAYYAMQELWSGSKAYEKNPSGKEYRTVQVTAEIRIPALMYHEFAADGSVSEDSLGQYTIYASEFEEDLRYLRDNGFTALTSRDIIAIEDGLMEMPEKPVLLTIDDGSYSVYDIAFPLLQKYNMRAVLAVIGSYTDDESLWIRQSGESAPERKFLFCTWDEIKKMQQSGFVEIISHSYRLHEYERQLQRVDSESWNDTAVNDAFRFIDSLNRQEITATPATAYPYSLRNRLSDQEIFETGSRILYAGDIYTLENDLSYSFLSRHCVKDVFLIPRQTRYHGKDVSACLEQFDEETAYIKGKGGGY